MYVRVYSETKFRENRLPSDDSHEIRCVVTPQHNEECSSDRMEYIVLCMIRTRSLINQLLSFRFTNSKLSSHIYK